MSGATPGGGTGEAASQRAMTSSLSSLMSSTISGPGVSRWKALATARVTASSGEQWTKPSSDNDAGAYGRSEAPNQSSSATTWKITNVGIPGCDVIRA